MGHCRIRLRDINGNAVGSANTGGTTPIAVMSANTTSNVWFGLRLSEKGVQPEQWNLGLCTWAPGDPVPVGKTCDSCIPVRLLEDGSNRLVPDPSGTPIVWNIIQATATKPGAENVM
ncbi:hypothetical protein HWV62_14386 [Athelia sp. TMB]|nr:hypothetical protein HWV62_14386 [Athelia sp. TMB]